jgi:hypothetical protein
LGERGQVCGGQRAIGAAVIERHRGDLGRVAEARGLLLAHRGPAECGSIMGRPTEAIAECELLAALDTEGHAVARFMHLDLLITSRESAVDYDWIETHGFEVAGPEAWPQPVRQNPGMNLRPPLVWELELLTGCLRDVPAFIAAVPPGNRNAAGSRDAMEWMSAAGWRLAWDSA